MANNKEEKTPTIISILLPTRGRTDMLKRSIESLVEKASNPQRLEFLLGIDEDDTNEEYIRENIAPIFKSKQIECKAQIFKPLGYSKLHTYVNTLAGAATGEWLFFWNDDGIMLTEGWDDVIESYNGQFRLLAPKDNHNGHPYAIFPIVPVNWFRLMDHLSLNAQNDAWLSQIAYMLDIFERIDVEFLHDRADLTGNNNDETFKNREYKEGNPEDPEDFAHPDMQAHRVRSTFKLAWFLDIIGQPSQWWADAVAGKHHPLAKMKWSRDIKGAGQLDAIAESRNPKTKKKIDDDETLSL